LMLYLEYKGYLEAGIGTRHVKGY
ncbi:MAG: hypothetical protein HW396_705, partial [Candidatus Dadabacteria bacterium]|nr:hypothetical protein [Candidatus Dadabacteria bacterium]